MKKVVLTYPESFNDLEEESSAISTRGLFVHPSFSERKLTVSTLFNDGKLEKIFTKDAIAAYEKSGIGVEIVK